MISDILKHRRPALIIPVYFLHGMVCIPVDTQKAGKQNQQITVNHRTRTDSRLYKLLGQLPENSLNLRIIPRLKTHAGIVLALLIKTSDQKTGNRMIDLKRLKKCIVKHFLVHGKNQNNIILPRHRIIMNCMRVQNTHIPLPQNHSLPIDRLIKTAWIHILHLNMLVRMRFHIIKPGMTPKKHIRRPLPFNYRAYIIMIHLLPPQTIHTLADLLPIP